MRKIDEKELTTQNSHQQPSGLASRSKAIVDQQQAHRTSHGDEGTMAGSIISSHYDCSPGRRNSQRGRGERENGAVRTTPPRSSTINRHFYVVFLVVLSFVVAAMFNVAFSQSLFAFSAASFQSCFGGNEERVASPPSSHDGVSNRVSLVGVSNRVSLEGIDPVYFDLFEEAQRRAAVDMTTPPLPFDGEGRGVVVGPTSGKFLRHTLTALRNGVRIRSILTSMLPTKVSNTSTSRYANNSGNTIKLALMTSKEHLEILEGCPNNTVQRRAEACRLWAKEPFDLILTTPSDEEFPYRGNDNHTNLANGPSLHKLKSLAAYSMAPFRETLFLDSDAFPCPGFDKLFLLTDPRSASTEPLFGKYWQMPTVAPADLAVGIDQFAKWQNHRWVPAAAGGVHNPIILNESIRFAERNTGVVLFSFHRPGARAFAHFVILVAEYVYNQVATTENKVTGDQAPFRIALFLFRKFQPDFVEHTIPMLSSCRTFPGLNNSGTDGFLNGMYPLQSDGEPCRECSCTPCLINHNADSWPVTIDGRMGWEE